ncbi:penicillin-binding protein [Bombilactobacillus folatiphilus]|uniref:Penicillin-binding protein n=1 Tax=Bombilactobacillus folatiphilus TaxID=2923362 RepID=A0ABY4PB11_9LACO|nr:penicillin-binding protein [Bombilactobacillus folatiphilus]UQS82701.1 penicillin-binding protein [Bombilactobacillus folatiphilus]
MSNHKAEDKRIINKARRDRRIIGRFFLIIIALFFIICIFRFTYITISGHVGSVDLSKRTEQKYRHKKTLSALRGSIFANDGTKIAYSDQSYELYAVIDPTYHSTVGKPLYVHDKKKTAQTLSRYIPMNAKEIYEILNPKEKTTFQVEFGTAGQNISFGMKKAIQKKHLQGIYFQAVPNRSYPNGNFASNTIGLAQISESTTKKKKSSQGVMGLESYYNKVLEGKNGYEINYTDPEGYTLPKTHKKTKLPVQGSNVYTTLDLNYQHYLEQLLDDVYTKYHPQSMQAIVTTPKNGHIIAISQRPTFNPDTKENIMNSWQDLNLQDTYEPGSVFKVLTLAASINSGNYNPNQYYHSGAITIGDRTIHDWNTNGWGEIPFNQAFPRSSNVGMVNLEQQMGASTWLKYMKKFKIGKLTNITLPGEVAGSINFQHASDQAITSFGQSVSVTALQMVQALGAIGNHGKLMQPQLVSQIENPNTGKIKKIMPKEVGQPVSDKTTQQVLDAMRDVVRKDYGTGSMYKIPGQDVAVKTGTAQISSSKGGYLTGSNDYVYSVAGLAPASNPKYLVYITMKKPQVMTKAPEQMLAEIFNPMMQRLLGTGKIENVETSDTSISMPELTNQSLASVRQTLNKQHLTAGVVGTGSKVVQQLPSAKTPVVQNQRVILLTDGAMTMPDVRGWSKNDLLKLAEITGKKIVLKGHGYAYKQSVAPQSVLNNVKEVVVSLKQN